MTERHEEINVAGDRAFDRVAAMVVDQLQVPVAVIRLEGANRTWFKAPEGVDAKQIDRLQDLCPPVLSKRAPAALPRIQTSLNYFFYAGVPLVSGRNRELGTLCAFDSSPRQVMSSQMALLQGLASLLVDRWELQNDAIEVARQRKAALALEYRALEENRLLTAMVQSSQDAIITKKLDSTVTSWNEAAQRLFGYSAYEMIGQSIRKLIPLDRSLEEDFVLASIGRGERIEHYETLRRHKDGHLIPISITVSPVRDADGIIVGASKIARDITERKAKEDHINYLMLEVNHRVKNQYAVILAMVRQTSKYAQTQRGFVIGLRDRIMALSRSHDLLVDREWKGVTLADLIATQIAPVATRDRVKLKGPPIKLSPSASQYLGMALHELATNSAQRGAMSGSPGGSVNVVWSIQLEAGTSRLDLEWQELGGPAVGQIAEGEFEKLVLTRITPDAMSGKGRIDVEPGRLTWALSAPLSGISNEPVGGK